MANSRIYAYLRASTHEQDASRAENDLKVFCQSKNVNIATTFIENESGATLKRPELFRLLSIAQTNDILLVEQVDRISRLNTQDWGKLKSMVIGKGIKIVSLDLPTSHTFLTSASDDFTGRILNAINSMMLDMLAAVARKDYEDRRRRQSQGIEKAKAGGKYRGRQFDPKLHDNIKRLLAAGYSYTDIQKTIGCSRPTIAKIAKVQRSSKADSVCIEQGEAK